MTSSSPPFSLKLSSFRLSPLTPIAELAVAKSLIMHQRPTPTHEVSNNPNSLAAVRVLDVYADRLPLTPPELENVLQMLIK